MLESLLAGYLITVEQAELPILCLSDCRSLFDHLNRQGVPRAPTDKRLAVDLAALRQALKSEMWTSPSGGYLVLYRKERWEALGQKLVQLVPPLAIGGGRGLISNGKIRLKTSV